MTVISTVKDPVTNKEITFAKGIIKKVNMKAYPEKKISTINKAGNISTIEATHKASLLLTQDNNDEWVNLGDVNSLRGNLQIKKDEQWIDIVEGMEISLVVTSNEYNNKTYYNSTKAKINILSTDNVQQQTSKSQNSSSQTSNVKIYGAITSITKEIAIVLDEKQGEISVQLGEHLSEVEVGMRITAFIDSSGSIVGGFKAYKDSSKTFSKEKYGQLAGGAANVAIHKIKDIKDFKQYTIKCYELIEELKEWAKKTYPEMDDYNLGARSGQSMNLASQLAKPKESLIELAQEIFKQLCEIELHIKTVKETPVNSPTKTLTLPEEDNSINVDTTDDESPLDFDDDIPF